MLRVSPSRVSPSLEGISDATMLLEIYIYSVLMLPLRHLPKVVDYFAESDDSLLIYLVKSFICIEKMYLRIGGPEQVAFPYRAYNNRRLRAVDPREMTLCSALKIFYRFQQ